MSESVCYESQSPHPWVQEICVMAASEMIAMMKVLFWPHDSVFDHKGAKQHGLSTV